MAEEKSGRATGGEKTNILCFPYATYLNNKKKRLGAIASGTKDRKLHTAKRFAYVR